MNLVLWNSSASTSKSLNQKSMADRYSILPTCHLGLSNIIELIYWLVSKRDFDIALRYDR